MLNLFRKLFRSNYQQMNAPALTFARVRYDTTRPYWGYVSRTSPLQKKQKRVKLNQAPCTCRMEGGTGSTKLPNGYQTLVRRLNSAAAFKYLTRKASGWVNIQPWPVVQDVLFGGTLVRVTEIDGNRAYIETLITKFAAPQITYEMQPWLVHQFSVIDQQGKIWKSPKGNAYVIAVSKARMWVPLEDLELFNQPPFGVTVNVPELMIHDTPNGPQTGGSLFCGTEVVIAEFAFRGPNAWGRIKNTDDWIALGATSQANYFTTSWTMETMPLW